MQCVTYTCRLLLCQVLCCTKALGCLPFSSRSRSPAAADADGCCCCACPSLPPSLTFPRFFSSLAQADKSITWSAASLSAGTDLSVEFRIDLCGYCDKYDGGRFNPIDSFQYE